MPLLATTCLGAPAKGRPVLFVPAGLAGGGGPPTSPAVTLTGMAVNASGIVMLAGAVDDLLGHPSGVLYVRQHGNEMVLSQTSGDVFVGGTSFSWDVSAGLNTIDTAGDYDISCAPSDDGVTPVGPEGPRTTFTVYPAPDANVVVTGTTPDSGAGDGAIDWTAPTPTNAPDGWGLALSLFDHSDRPVTPGETGSFTGLSAGTYDLAVYFASGRLSSLMTSPVVAVIDGP